MTTTVVEPRVAAAVAATPPPSRPWPAKHMTRAEVEAQLRLPEFVSVRDSPAHRIGVKLTLDWLQDQPGNSWQERWLTSGVEADVKAWRQTPISWLTANGHGTSRHDGFFRALRLLIGIDVIRPSMGWLVSARFGHGSLSQVMARHRDQVGLARLTALCLASPDAPRAAVTRTTYRAAILLAAKGGVLADITTGDVLELLDIEADARGTAVGATRLFYRLLHVMGVFGEGAPATLRQLRTSGQRTPEQMVDRYRLRVTPVRDLLVDYLRERQPALDYTSLESLAGYLVGLFWADIERHHPEITSLQLPTAVADAWKQRLRTITKTVRDADGRTTVTTTPRINYRESLTPVRAFYLDLAHWAVEDPARWAVWVAPSPVGNEEVSRRKDQRRRKSRMDTRTRNRLPVLPVLVRTVSQRRIDAAAVLDAARAAHPGELFTAAGQMLRRVAPARSAATKVWAEEPTTGRRRNLGHEEEYAFWGWATIEILRSTGIRIEELTELSHHSLIQYRLPTTAEIVPLLQIAPSKTDTERLLVVSPELADVLAMIIHRVRGADGTIPAIPSYDVREKAWRPAAPLLFQRRYGHERRPITTNTIRDMLTAALAETGLIEPSTNELLRFTPHDFRRLFITDAIMTGMPPHIAQVIAGHHDINVTMSYATIYPDEAIQAHRAFLARRRSLRPSEEYRAPTDEEWTQFLGHFERRKVSLGTCGRAFGTPCIHEHACVRCPMLWPEPHQRERLVEIIENLTARIAEAQREGWLGEIEGLKISKAGAVDKLAQIDRRTRPEPVHLGMPTSN